MREETGLFSFCAMSAAESPPLPTAAWPTSWASAREAKRTAPAITSDVPAVIASIMRTPSFSLRSGLSSCIALAVRIEAVFSYTRSSGPSLDLDQIARNPLLLDDASPCPVKMQAHGDRLARTRRNPVILPSRGRSRADIDFDVSVGIGLEGRIRRRQHDAIGRRIDKAARDDAVGDDFPRVVDGHFRGQDHLVLLAAVEWMAAGVHCGQ